LNPSLPVFVCCQNIELMDSLPSLQQQQQHHGN